MLSNKEFKWLLIFIKSVELQMDINNYINLAPKPELEHSLINLLPIENDFLVKISYNKFLLFIISYTKIRVK